MGNDFLSRLTDSIWTRDQAAAEPDRVFSQALALGPQAITMPDGRRLIVVSEERYRARRPGAWEVLRDSAGLDAEDDPFEVYLRQSRDRDKA